MVINIGVLSYQGSVKEHMECLSKIDGVNAREVKTIEALNGVDGIILPGGESTTISKLLKHFGLLEPLLRRVVNGMPVWGTCAGLILLAKTIENESPHLGTMDIKIKRNAYGRQLESFIQDEVIKEFNDSPIPLVFIRAPWIASAEKNVNILCKIDGHIVAARQENQLVTSFHPELTEDLSAHKYFAKMVSESKEKKQ